MDKPFFGIDSVFLIFCQYFLDSINFFQRPLIFPSSRDQIAAVWMVSRCGGGGGGRWGGGGGRLYSRTKGPFPNIGEVILIFR